MKSKLLILLSLFAFVGGVKAQSTTPRTSAPAAGKFYIYNPQHKVYLKATNAVTSNVAEATIFTLDKASNFTIAYDNNGVTNYVYEKAGNGDPKEGGWGTTNDRKWNVTADGDGYYIWHYDPDKRDGNRARYIACKGTVMSYPYQGTPHGFLNWDTSWTTDDNNNRRWQFIPVMEANLKCNADKFGTFVAPFAVAIPQGLNAWTVASVGSTGHIELEPVTGTIPANTPVILENEGSSLINTTVYGPDYSGSATSIAGDNNLTGVYEATKISSGYVMQTINGKQMFYKVSASDPITVPANRCYMNQDSYVKGLYFNADDATAIEAVEALTSEDVKIFDINGRKLNRLQKGINIVNGKKIMVK